MRIEAIPAVLSATALEELLGAEPTVRLLDVRTPGEYESVHIRGAYNVPLDRLDEHARDIQAHVDTPVVLICQSGARARKAEDALRAAGMPQLHILEGGVNGWVAAGRPMERGSKRVSLERQVRFSAGVLAAAGALLAIAVNPLFALLPLFVGAGLAFAGLTDWCGMALVLARLPYNRPASCDVDAMVRSLKEGVAPAGVGRTGRSAAPPQPSCAA
jgi:rhodanese-related sulfurtransferase